MFDKVDHERLERALSQLFTSVHGVEVKVNLTKKDCQLTGNPNGENCCNNYHQTKEWIVIYITITLYRKCDGKGIKMKKKIRLTQKAEETLFLSVLILTMLVGSIDITQLNNVKNIIVATVIVAALLGNMHVLNKYGRWG